jgi:hypothetical protein
MTVLTMVGLSLLLGLGIGSVLILLLCIACQNSGKDYSDAIFTVLEEGDRPYDQIT